MFSLYSRSLGADVKQMENRYERERSVSSHCLESRI